MIVGNPIFVLLTIMKMLGHKRMVSPRVHATNFLPTEHASLLSTAVYLVIYDRLFIVYLSTLSVAQTLWHDRGSHNETPLTF